MQGTIRTKLVESGIPAELEARVKGLYSLHRKILRQQSTLEQVYDLLAVRVITDTERNCYAALGVMHHIWRPVPGRFKDYIAMPRPNLYQSLHTTVMHGGQPFEVQIRTQEMHRIAEEGVAAHWKYKGGKTASGDDDQRIAWMRQLIEWSQEMQEPGEFLSTLKWIWRPSKSMPSRPKAAFSRCRAAPPCGFCLFRAHRSWPSMRRRESERTNGFRCATRLSTATWSKFSPRKATRPAGTGSASSSPRTRAAKSASGSTSMNAKKPRKWAAGFLEKEARQCGLNLKKIRDEELTRVATEYGCARTEDLYAELGYGKWSARQVLGKATGQDLVGKAGEEKSPEAGFHRQAHAGHQGRRHRGARRTTI